MNRKNFIKKGMISALAAGTFINGCTSENNSKKSSSSPTDSKKYKWKMATAVPPGFPILGESANLFAEIVKKASTGRLEIKVFGAGELVPALEMFDAVSSGTIECCSGPSFYWAGKIPCASAFTAVPFGMNARQMTAWLMHGEGLKLWREAYAPFGILPFPGGNTGGQAGGWYRKEINSPEDLKGLKMRIPGLGGKILEKAGGTSLLVAGGEIFINLERGVIDATEWVGPYHDFFVGFHKIAKYYYFPGWHEPSGQTEISINKKAYESLPEDLQMIIESASVYIQNWMLGEFDKRNSLYLKKIREETDVEIKQFPNPFLKLFKELSNEVIEELKLTDPMSKKVFDSYFDFKKSTDDWYQISE